MSAIGVVGDAATTTALALAVTRRDPAEVVVVEADPRGGTLAAWLDVPATPSLSTAVAAGLHRTPGEVVELARLTPSGVRLLPAPVRSVEARRAVAEAETSLLPALASLPDHDVVVDLGRRTAADSLGGVRACDVCVVVHRQPAQSSGAAAVAVERLAELVDAVAGIGVATVLAVVGAQPFDPVEVGAFAVGDRVDLPVVALADDPVAAAVLAGRTGVSARRLARLPLLRTAARLAEVVDHELRRTALGAEVGA
ncbi:MAG: hypothetical protein MUE78_10270 [Ilumatobacteraceae bacterium]|jgi:MinD-like ATPase involved in chromosome partitioning or flagellar assembly|nr:hypothetical protein [Ilumatobacteraceae bacterium]